MPCDDDHDDDDGGGSGGVRGASSSRWSGTGIDDDDDVEPVNRARAAALLSSRSRAEFASRLLYYIYKYTTAKCYYNGQGFENVSAWIQNCCCCPYTITGKFKNLFYSLAIFTSMGIEHDNTHGHNNSRYTIP